MDDYIARQALIDATDDKYSLGDIGRMERDIIVNALTYAPAADVRPVVCCKDCKSYFYADNRIPVQQGWVCERYNAYRRPDDYCSCGVRRGSDG